LLKLYLCATIFYRKYQLTADVKSGIIKISKAEQILCVKCQKMGVEFLNEKPVGLRYNITSAVLKIFIFFITAPAQ